MSPRDFAPGVDLAWADDYAEACQQRDEALDALDSHRLALDSHRQALAERIRHHWRLIHECRRERDLAPTALERLAYQRQVERHMGACRELLAIRRAARRQS